MVSSKKEIRDHILSATDTHDSTMETLINDYINLTLNEINEPGWAYPKNERHHLWSWLRRKTTFTTVDGQTDYVLGRDIDKIALIRQTSTPALLKQYSDEEFFSITPDPTLTGEGNPRIFRLWDVSGVSTLLSAADTVNVVSNSGSDDGDNDLAVTVWGYVGGIIDSEKYVLDGTNSVVGTKTFQARDLFVSKSKQTVGTITVTEASGATTLVTLGPEERAPHFKVVSLYPTPSSAITMYVQFYTRIRELVNDSDVPQFDSKWHYIVVLGTLGKVYKHLGKTADELAVQAQYAAAVRAMINSDMTNPSLIPQMKRHNPLRKEEIYVYRSEDTIV